MVSCTFAGVTQGQSHCLPSSWSQVQILSPAHCVPYGNHGSGEMGQIIGVQSSEKVPSNAPKQGSIPCHAQQYFSGIAQLVEQQTLNLRVLGSIPSSTVMIETRKLNIGDLVYADDGSLGMIEHFDMGYVKFKVDWFGLNWGSHSWLQVQRFRNNYLDFRRNMK